MKWNLPKVCLQIFNNDTHWWIVLYSTFGHLIDPDCRWPLNHFLTIIYPNKSQQLVPVCIRSVLDVGQRWTMKSLKTTSAFNRKQASPLFSISDSWLSCCSQHRRLSHICRLHAALPVVSTFQQTHTCLFCMCMQSDRQFDNTIAWNCISYCSITHVLLYRLTQLCCCFSSVCNLAVNLKCACWVTILKGWNIINMFSIWEVAL